ncbi:MAG: hypothetical protein JW806_08470 [Sedimentisphaerales bacterium]|nr:hypothetical protein [Sedimentisphaerales bacterium]
MKNNSNKGLIKRIRANRKVRKTLSISTGIVTVLVILWSIDLFMTPPNYRIVEPPADDQPSMYLTNYILPELNNKSQYGEPFEIVFSQQGINDVLMRHIDVNSMKEAGMSDLSVSFEEGRILFVSKTTVRGFTFYPTIVLKPRTDEHGKFFLELTRMQLGNSKVPFADKIIKEKILESFENLTEDSKDSDFVKALFNESQAKPVFSVNRNKVSVEGITVEKGRLTAYFMPQSD